MGDGRRQSFEHRALNPRQVDLEHCRDFGTGAVAGNIVGETWWRGARDTSVVHLIGMERRQAFAVRGARLLQSAGANMGILHSLAFPARGAVNVVLPALITISGNQSAPSRWRLRRRACAV